MLTNEMIKEGLIEINPSARTFFSNFLEQSTGLNPKSASEFTYEQSIQFFKHIWANALSAGNQRPDYIEKSLQALEPFLSNFHTTAELRDFNEFSKRLENFPSERSDSSKESDKVVRTTENLQKLPSVGFKTACLIMRFLCLDSNFFEIDKSKLIPPLDRVNHRIGSQVFGSSFKNKIGKIQPSFPKEKTIQFANIGKEVLGDNMILIDNLWFIGHFYHDGTNCNLREVLRIIEFPYLKKVNLPNECPFKKYGCCRS